ncbi:MAG: two-component regulator propeller domain-containing protein [Alkalispirochaeta sp.]
MRTVTVPGVCFLVCTVLFLAVPTGRVVAQDFFTGGQGPRINLIDRSDGLPHNAVSSIQQDTRGFLWFGTQGGLARFDGRGFERYQNVPFDTTSLPHDLIQTIYYCDRHDYLWVGTYRGLARMVLGEAGFTTYAHDPEDPTSLTDNVVIAISRGPDHDLWVGTQNGLNRMNDDGTFQRIPTESEVVRALFLDSRNDLWVGTYAGLSRWNRETRELERVDFGWSSPFVMAIREESPGRLLLGTWGNDADEGGLVRVDLDAETFEEIRFADNRVYTVLPGSDGTLWAGTWGGGLFAVTPEGTQYAFSADTSDNLVSPVVYSLFEDQSGIVWVGTNGGGLHYMSPRQRNFRAFYHDPDDPDSLPGGKINVIYRDSRDRLWVGLYGGGLARYDEGKGRWVRYTADSSDPYASANDIITVIYEDSKGRLWIGNNEALQLFDEENERFLTWGVHVYPGVEYSGEIIYQVIEDADGYFWIGTYRGGLTRVDLDTGETRVFQSESGNPRSLSDNLVYDLFVDSRDELWIATNGGLNRFDPETETFDVYRYDPDNADGLTSNTVRVLFEDGKNNFWIGTVSGGLNRLDRDTGTFTHVTQLDGLSDNSVLSILEGGDGRLWLGTQQGLSAYDVEQEIVDVLDERDGLHGSEFQNGALKDRDGTLLFGGSHGITRIDSSVALQNTHPPSVQIVDIQVFQRSIAPNRHSFNDSVVELGPDDSFFSFEFVGLDFESPDSNRYAFQLVGFDRERIDAGTRNFATYTNIPPGEYEFRAWAANGDGVWTDTPASVGVTIIAPWYRRWWAFILYGVIAIVLIVGALRWRTARILAEKNEDLQYANAQLERANRELERLSVRDALTGLFNRRYFDSRLQEEWFRARRSARPIALLMIDVDHFKHFNDTYGHIVGDHVLANTAQVCESVVSRHTDFIARYGGEEFVALLFDTPIDGAMQIAERIREAIKKNPLVSGVDRITVSVGACSVIPEGEDTPDTLVAVADRALYTAKKNGRDRVEGCER